jgi:small GTP-binding protein
VKAFKVILVGSQSVGKSSILNRISDGRFSNSYTPTIGIDFKTYSVDIGSRVYSLQIWDTAGQ